MFKIIPVQVAYQNKFSRQKKVRGIEISKDGLCAHIGKISPGCFWCLSSTALSFGVNLGSNAGLENVCNLNCPYCFMQSNHLKGTLNSNIYPQSWKLNLEDLNIIKEKLISLDKLSQEHEFISFAFTGDGAEPLLYMPVIRTYMNFFKEKIEPKVKRRTWYKIYTNGVYADSDTVNELKDLGITEIRFHIGATNFSNVIFKKMKYAAKVLNTVSVETPAWPPHKKKLLDSLKTFNDIGIKHLNLIEVAITQFNMNSIKKSYPNAKVYHSHVGLAIDDEGLVYDLMKETIINKYNFSVLDCNTLIRKIRDFNTFNRYFRGALKAVDYGKDWSIIGNKPE